MLGPVTAQTVRGAQRGASSAASPGRTPSEPPLLVVLDGDGLLHRAYHGMAGDDERDALGRPTWALRGLVTALAQAAARLRPDAVLVALDSHEQSVRAGRHAAYKAHRPEKDHDLQVQLDLAPDLLGAAGVPFACVRGYEGDDVMASGAALAREAGWRSVLVTSDRDTFALVDDTTSVLRVGDGGVEAGSLVTPTQVRTAYGVLPAHYRDLAALRGDPSDNLPGVAGIGEKTAARLLGAFGSLDAALHALDDDRAAEVEAVVGAACAAALADPDTRDVVELNRHLMTMHDDLPLPDLDELRLPLEPSRLIAALRARGIRLGRSLWALVGGEPPPWAPNGYDTVPKALRLAEEPAPWEVRVVPTLAELADLREATARAVGQAVEQAARAAVATVDLTAAATGRRRGRPVAACEDQLELF